MAVNLPVQNFFSRTTGPATYSRPACWPVITDVATEVQFLFCDLGDASCSIRTLFTRTSGSQNIVIDWGDGTTNTVTTIFSTNTNHTYTLGSGTPCPSLGYTTFKIRVYFTGTGVSVLNNCNIMPILINNNIASPQSCAVLEAYYGDSTQTTTANFNSSGQSAGSLGQYKNLQYVKLPATVSWTSWAAMFYQCSSLIKVVMPTSNSAMTQLSTTFYECFSLLEVTFPSNSTGITTLAQTFQSCTNLRSVTFPTTMNSCTGMDSCFNNCFNLRSITLPSINSVSAMSSTFSFCEQLEWVKFTSMPTVVGAINMASCFNACSNLQNVYFPATGTAGSIYNFNSTFGSCRQLKSIVLPSNINASTYTNAFNACTMLASCILPTNAPNCNSYTNMFTSCVNLIRITLPTAPTIANGLNGQVSLAQMFFQCTKLEEITIPSGYVITDMGWTCYGCSSLKTFTWTPGNQPVLTSLYGAFQNCYLLTSITMPTTYGQLTNLGSTFQNCRSLSSVIFTSTINTVTTMANCFQNCNNLRSVTMPTSMSACTDFRFTFSGCSSITSITLPYTVGDVTTFRACFYVCVSLKTCVLPGAAQLSAVTTIELMFYSCSNLTTLTNFAKIGSLAATPLINANQLYYNRFTGGSAISFSGPLSKLDISSNSGQATYATDVQSVRLLNASAGQWTGTSPHISVGCTNMSTAQIVQLFNDMAAQGTQTPTKTINITGATGAAGLTAANRLIVTSKGWTITG